MVQDISIFITKKEQIIIKIVGSRIGNVHKVHHSEGYVLVRKLYNISQLTRSFVIYKSSLYSIRNIIGKQFDCFMSSVTPT